MFKSSAPGSLMLLGEHAVLHNYSAMSCAINQRITVTLSSRSDDMIIINSPHYGLYQTTINNLQIQAPYTFVLASLNYFLAKKKQGISCVIESDFSSQLGLGSSAAVTVAMTHALSQLLGYQYSLQEIAQHAFNIVLQVQGVASGADVAASTFGGILHYYPSPRRIIPLKNTLPITVIYSGKKVPTIDVIHHVAKNYEQFPSLYRELFKKIGDCTEQGASFLAKAQYVELGNVFNQQQELLQAIHVSTPLLDELVQQANDHPAVLGAKISGAGLGDCIIALGHLPDRYFPHNYQQSQAGVKQLTIAIEPNGVMNL